MLHCPLYQASIPLNITWHYADTYLYEDVNIDETKAVSDNGTTLLVSFRITYHYFSARVRLTLLLS